MNVLMLAPPGAWRRIDAFPAIRDGLEHIGHAVDLAQLTSGNADKLELDPYDLLVVWNGRKPPSKQVVTRARRRDPRTRTLILERGFFNRMRYTQLDLAGFNHTASWAETLESPPPEQGADRLFKALGRHPARQRARSDGYILLLCQVPGDAQLRDCCVHHPQSFCDLIRDAVPSGIPVRVRAHPQSNWKPESGRVGGSLREALAGARFCVTLNSGAANEAIARGVPVLALGPALCLRGRAARPARPATLCGDIRDMLDGWRPVETSAKNFLYHLAAHQHNAAELREGSVLRQLLGA
jgi:hypothetical protein